MTGSVGRRSTRESAKTRKPRVLLIVGYHYLSAPIFVALRERLADFEVRCYYPKDIIGADINVASAERGLLRDDPAYSELSYDPPWFRPRGAAWYERSIFQRAAYWLTAFPGIRRYRGAVAADIRALDPDLIVVTSDIFFASRIIAVDLPGRPLAVIQPAFLDLRPRPMRHSLMKRIVNWFARDVFNSQQYFGMEILRAHLLIWGSESFAYYRNRRTGVHRVANPAHVVLRDRARALRADPISLASHLGLDPRRQTVVILTGRFETLYGTAFQVRLARGYQTIVARLAAQYNIILKVHPNDTIDAWRNVIAGRYEGVQILRDVDKTHLLASCDVAIATDSYVSVEAALAGAVVVNYFPGERTGHSGTLESIERCYALDTGDPDAVAMFVAGLSDAEHFNKVRGTTDAVVADLLPRDDKLGTLLRSLIDDSVSATNPPAATEESRC
jgi:hypothetical protein